MSVAPSVFVSAMRGHWINTLGNVTSPDLEAVWHQIASTFNRQIAAFGTTDADRWRVLQPATGTGKSQGLAVYCSLLPTFDHPGVLIVTRLKTQADEIAATINKLVGNTVALAYHGDNRVPADTLPTFPVLVITHRAYEIGLDAINKGSATASSWDRYHEWNDGKRKLTVIDEALDIIEEAQIDLERVRFVRCVIPFAVAEQYPAQMSAIAALEDLLIKIARTSTQRDTKEHERFLWRGAEAMAMPDTFDMTPLRRALQGVRLDFKLLRENDPKKNLRLIKQYDTILRDIQATLENWNWYARKLSEHTINTARLIVPEDISGAVVLDATASSNLIYRLFGEQADVVPVPSKARSYANVTLHVSTGHAVGKTSMLKNIKEEGPKLIANLKEQLGHDRKVFVCCHKYVAPQLVSYDTGFAAFDVGHWGAIDGRNDWQTYDTAVIFGLPYRDRVWSANTFMALCGPQSTEWLNSDGDRPFQQYRDIRHSLEVGQLVVSVVQAMNRTRNRKVIDEQGNCLPTDIFLLLPGDKTGKEILAGITDEMPDIKVVEWSYGEAKTKPRRSNYEEALVRYASVMIRGRKAVSDVRSDLGISPTTWERLRVQAKDIGTSHYQRLIAEGVRYEADGTGRGNRAYLIKA
jgi:hypothetical protein